MQSNGRKFYFILLTVFVAGYTWIGLNYFYSDPIAHTLNSACMIKQFTGVPCPSCGTTRSLNLLLHGNFVEASLINPLGILSGLIMLIVPFWLLVDLFTRNYSFLLSYKKIEVLFRNKQIAIMSVALLMINWIWNISKGL